MMLLKGYGLSLNYPIPSHRPLGDIDIYLWDLWRYADQMVEQKLGIAVDHSHHHHSVFHFEGQMVENHYDFINVHSHRSNKRVEKLFKSLADDKCKAVSHHLPNGKQIYFPSPDLNAVYVSRHNACHFASEQMNLRQLLDWVLFVDKHNDKVDWSMFWKEVEKMGMTKFVLCMNAIAVKELGFDECIFHTPEGYRTFATDSSVLVGRMLNDILYPEFDEKSGSGVVRYIWSRTRRWWHNRWKHKMVYSDNLLSTFLVQIRSHLMKPATLVGK